MSDPAARLAEWRVLVPHGGDWGDRVTSLLVAEGAQAVVVPLITFAPPEEVTALDAAVGRLADRTYDWVTVTSGTTVTALADRVAALLGPEARLADALAGTRVAAVGPGTARVLAAHGVTPDLLPSGERSAAGLVAEMTALPGSAARVLVPRSDLAEPTVVDGLRAAGWAVDDVVAYRTVPGPPPDDEVRAAWASGTIHAVLLSSASTARNLVDLLGAPPSSVVVCCIGSRTSAAARGLGLRVDVVPDAASAEELVAALAAAAPDTAGPDTAPPDPDHAGTPDRTTAPHPDRSPL